MAPACSQHCFRRRQRPYLSPSLMLFSGTSNVAPRPLDEAPSFYNWASLVSHTSYALYCTRGRGGVAPYFSAAQVASILTKKPLGFYVFTCSSMSIEYQYLVF